MVYTKEAEKHSKIGYDAFDAPYIGLEVSRGCSCLQHAQGPHCDKDSLSRVSPVSLLALQDMVLKITITWELDPEAR